MNSSASPGTPAPGPHSEDLLIEGMTCASCVGRVERALKAVPGVSQASVNLATERASVQTDGSVPREALQQAVRKAGYEVSAPAAQELLIEGMTCASCVGRVERALKAVPGVQSASVNLATERASVQGSADRAVLLAAVSKAGYSASVVEDSGSSEDQQAQRHADELRVLKRDLWLAAALTLPVFVLEMGAHLVPAFHHVIATSLGTRNSWLLQFVLTTLVLVFPGRRFYQKGIPALLRAAPDMNSLVAVGTLAAYGFSLVATFLPRLLPAGTVNVYYEAAAVIVTLILLGRVLEAKAKGRTSEAIKRLLKLQAKTARVRREGTVVELPLAQIASGDVIEVRPGERIAVDGEVIDGDSYVD